MKIKTRVSRTCAGDEKDEGAVGSLEVTVACFEDEEGLCLILDWGNYSSGERKVENLEENLLEPGIKGDRRGGQRTDKGKC